MIVVLQLPGQGGSLRRSAAFCGAHRLELKPHPDRKVNRVCSPQTNRCHWCRSAMLASLQKHPHVFRAAKLGYCSRSKLGNFHRTFVLSFGELFRLRCVFNKIGSTRSVTDSQSLSIPGPSGMQSNGKASRGRGACDSRDQHFSVIPSELPAGAIIRPSDFPGSNHVAESVCAVLDVCYPVLHIRSIDQARFKSKSINSWRSGKS